MGLIIYQSNIYCASLLNTLTSDNIQMRSKKGWATYVINEKDNFIVIKPALILWQFISDDLLLHHCLFFYLSIYPWSSGSSQLETSTHAHWRGSGGSGGKKGETGEVREKGKPLWIDFVKKISQWADESRGLELKGKCDGERRVAWCPSCVQDQCTLPGRAIHLPRCTGWASAPSDRGADSHHPQKTPLCTHMEREGHFREFESFGGES